MTQNHPATPRPREIALATGAGMTRNKSFTIPY
jgi:hypothetical protein